MGDYDYNTNASTTVVGLLKTAGGYERPSGRGWL